MNERFSQLLDQEPDQKSNFIVKILDYFLVIP